MTIETIVVETRDSDNYRSLMMVTQLVFRYPTFIQNFHYGLCNIVVNKNFMVEAA